MLRIVLLMATHSHTHLQRQIREATRVMILIVCTYILSNVFDVIICLGDINRSLQLYDDSIQDDLADLSSLFVVAATAAR